MYSLKIMFTKLGKSYILCKDSNILVTKNNTVIYQSAKNIFRRQWDIKGIVSRDLNISFWHHLIHLKFLHLTEFSFFGF
jgi:hypothetical protein